MKSLLPLLVVTAAVILSFGCGKSQGGTEDKASRTWTENLRGDGITKSGIARVIGQDQFVGMMDGYQLWRGSYRGIPIALYSCMFQHSTFFQAEHPGEYPRQTLGVKFVRVVLVTEEGGRTQPSSRSTTAPAKARRVYVASREYVGGMIDVARFVANPQNDATAVAIGAATVKVEDGGNGVLRFKFDALKEPQWDSFDLEHDLRGWGLVGDKKIVEPVSVKYSPEQFAQAVITELAKLKLNTKDPGRNFPTGAAEELVAHPMWNDAEAITALLKAANNEQLVFVLNVIRAKQSFDPWYLSRLEKATPALMALAKNDSDAVREVFAGLAPEDWFWPKELAVMEPLLRSQHSIVADCAIATFVHRKHIPADMEQVRKLLNSSDEDVRLSAETLIRLEDKLK